MRGVRFVFTSPGCSTSWLNIHSPDRNINFSKNNTRGYNEVMTLSGSKTHITSRTPYYLEYL